MTLQELRRLYDEGQQATIRPEDACSLLPCSRPTLYKAIREGQCPALRLGHKILIPIGPFLRMIGDLEGEDASDCASDALHVMPAPTGVLRPESTERQHACRPIQGQKDEGAE